MDVPQSAKMVSLPSIHQMFPGFLTDMRLESCPTLPPLNNTIPHHPYLKRRHEDITGNTEHASSSNLKLSPPKSLIQRPVSAQRTALDDILPRRCASAASSARKSATPGPTQQQQQSHIRHSGSLPFPQPKSPATKYSFDILRCDPTDPTTLQHLSSSTVFSPNSAEFVGCMKSKSSPERIAKGSAPIFKVNAMPSRALPFPVGEYAVEHIPAANWSRMSVNNPQPLQLPFAESSCSQDESSMDVDEDCSSGTEDGDDGDEWNSDVTGKKHTCLHCNKRFSRPSSLRIHINTHTGAMPFLCPWPNCGRKFNVNSNMRRHSRNHWHSELGVGTIYTDEGMFTRSRSNSHESSDDSSIDSSSSTGISGSSRSCSPNTSSFESSVLNIIKTRSEPALSSRLRYYAQSHMRGKGESIDADSLP